MSSTSTCPYRLAYLINCNNCRSEEHVRWELEGWWLELEGLVHDNAHARHLSLQNKFVGSTLNSKSPLPVQSLKILRFIRTSVALAGLVILR